MPGGEWAMFAGPVWAQDGRIFPIGHNSQMRLSQAEISATTLSVPGSSKIQCA